MDEARTWLPRALAAASFLVFTVLAPPSFYWLDSAELSAAGLQLGSAHPTGFPLYCVLVRAAALIPLGDLAFRVNLLSALSGALAVMWTARLIIESTPRTTGALVAAAAASLSLLFTLVFFTSSTVAEVYAPTAALITATLLVYRRVAQGADSRSGLTLAVLVGVGLAFHGSYRLLMCGPVFLLMVVRLRRGARWPLFAPVVIVFMTVAAYSYLPVRSATGRTAAVDWGHPDTLGAVLAHGRGDEILNAYDQDIFSGRGVVVADNFRIFFGEMADELGPLILLAALVGVVWLGTRRRQRWLLFALLVVVVLDVVYAVWINPMGLEDRQNGVPLAVGMSVLAGLGVAWFSRLIGRAGPWVASVVGVAMVVPAALVTLEVAVPASRDDLPSQWAGAILNQAPPNGIALVTNDSTAAGLLYATTVEGQRPDVAVLVRQRLGDVERTASALERAGVSARPDRGGDDPWGRVAAAERRLLWEPGSDVLGVAGTVVPAAPLFVVEGPAATTAVSERLMDAAATLEHVFSGPGADSEQSRFAHAHALTQLAVAAIGIARQSGRDDVLTMAEQLLRRALDRRGRHHPALTNLSAVASMRGQTSAALRLAGDALAIAPNDMTALVNSGRFSIAMGHDQQAAAYLERALAVDNSSASAWALLGVVHARARRFDEARKHFERALTMDPDNREARDNLSKLPN